MVKIRHLETTDYVLHISQSLPQAIIPVGNIYLEKTKDFSNLSPYELNLHAKFDSSNMNGMLINAALKRNNKDHASHINTIKIYRVADESWVTSLVYTATPTQSGTVWNSYVSQANLGLNELSGAETYMIVVEAQRRARMYRKSVYVNHLGCFDSLNRLRQETELLKLIKLDE